MLNLQILFSLFSSLSFRTSLQSDNHHPLRTPSHNQSWVTLVGFISSSCLLIPSPPRHILTNPMVLRKMPLSSSITAEKNSPLERSRGRVQLIGGDFYYSPNS